MHRRCRGPRFYQRPESDSDFGSRKGSRSSAGDSDCVEGFLAGVKE